MLSTSFQTRSIADLGFSGGPSYRLPAQEVTMTRKDIHEFFRQAEQDAGLREELDRALAQDQGAVTAFLAAAAARGFQFTAEEFVESLPAWRASREGTELDDAELEKVAGGVASQSTGLASGLFSRLANRIAGLRAGPGAGQLGTGLAAEDEENVQT
jgi:predicted ribosomally synthesized peptide with nif11-like leader